MLLKLKLENSFDFMIQFQINFSNRVVLAESVVVFFFMLGFLLINLK